MNRIRLGANETILFFMEMIIAGIFFLFILTTLRPAFGAVALFSLLPTYFFKATVAGIPSTFLELSTYALVLGILVRVFFDTELRKQITARIVWLWSEKREFILLIASFLFVVLIFTFVSLDMRRSAGIFKGWFVAPIIAGAAVFFVINKRTVPWLLALLSTTGAILSAYGLWEYFTFYQDWFKDFHFRLNSVFTSANYLALFIGPIISASLGWLLFSRQVKNNIAPALILVVTTAVNLVALFFTFSYGGYLAVGLSILFLVAALIFTRKNKKFIYITLSMVAVIFAFTFSAVLKSDKFQRDFLETEGESALRGRVEVWQTAVYAIKQNPIVGTGLGNFDKVYDKYVRVAIPNEPLEPNVILPHNVFLNFWIDTGILGLIMFISVLSYAYILFSKVKRNFPYIAYPAAAILIAIIGHGLVDTSYFKNDLSYLFWLPIALLLYANYETYEQNR